MAQQTLSTDQSTNPTVGTPTADNIADLKDLHSYYPPIDSPLQPICDRIVVQLRRPKTVTSGIIISNDAQNIEKYNQCNARLLAAGNEAVVLMKEWGIELNDFVRIPLYGGDRIEVPCPTEYRFESKHTHQVDDNPIILATIRVTEILSKIIVDPRSIKTYI
jgi:co-chaperonin GroES (HSP10)